MKQIDKIIQDALSENNVLSANDIIKYAANASGNNEPFKDYLLKNSLVTEKQILIALSQHLKLDTINISSTSIDQSLIEKVPVKIVGYYKFMPVKMEKKVVTIAVAGPISVKIQDEIRMHLGYEVSMVLATESDLNAAIKKYYGFATDTIDRILVKDPQRANVTTSSDSGQWIEDLEKQTDDPTVSHLVNQIILEAYKMRATDIHIEPYRDKVRFRYRIDGVLVDANLPPEAKHFLAPILSRIKILANLSITEKRLPQDGSAVVKTKEQTLDLRVSTLPTPRGESMVIRVLPANVMLFSLEKLGFDTASVKTFRQLIEKPHGIIFITGPTGSGKTTTLYACLNEINSSERKIITIEDPVEYEVDGITQVQVNQKVQFSFSTGLRSLLRHDPDIIMVGEVRDVETAEIAIRTALTGHLVFSTLHTNDAASGITRLIDMGVEAYLVASSVEAFVAQRLVRVICPQCKEPDLEAPAGIREEIARDLGLNDADEVNIFKGKGCERCNGTGFYGRIAIYEILIMNDAIRTAILEMKRSDQIKKIAMREGLITLRQNGWQAVMNGLTTPMEVMNVSVKDEKEETSEQSPISALSPSVKEAELEAPFIKSFSKDEYNSRIYPRSFEPVEMRYRLVKRDPANHNHIIYEGVEHPTVTKDLSARGLRFISKSLLPIGSILEIKIQLEEGEKSVECLAKVCRVEEDSMENVYKIANYFLDISSADRALIGQYVEQKLNRKKEEAVKEKV